MVVRMNSSGRFAEEVGRCLRSVLPSRRPPYEAALGGPSGGGRHLCSPKATGRTTAFGKLGEGSPNFRSWPTTAVTFDGSLP